MVRSVVAASLTMQLPAPAGPIPVAIPVFGMLMVVAIVGFVAVGPVGRAIGRVLLHVFGADRQPPLPAAEVAELRTMLESQQRQIAELAERQDFAERLLAQAREKGLPPGGGGGA